MSALSKSSSKTPRLSKVDAAAFPANLSKGLSAACNEDASVTDQIVRAVTQAIVEHRLLPGTKLVEQTIGDRFGVSRTVVRQALFRLQQAKLVTQEPARGTFVAQPSVVEAREVFAVRRMIEGQMVRDLVQHATAADLKRLKAHIKAEQQAVQRLDVAQRTTLLFDFHVVLAKILANQVLADLMAELVSRCSLITLMYQSAAHASESHTEHADIVQAIEARDANRAVTLMDAHLQAVEQQLTEHRRVPT
ncbi:MAG: GntR family transcriptional regulator [Burkholderiales bacterium]|nr:GntR family transcriptional regulator [Burkholderiales bacterium]